MRNQRKNIKTSFRGFVVSFKASQISLLRFSKGPTIPICPTGTNTSQVTARPITINHSGVGRS